MLATPLGAHDHRKSCIGVLVKVEEKGRIATALPKELSVLVGHRGDPLPISTVRAVIF
jgi:hypothetical protein